MLPEYLAVKLSYGIAGAAGGLVRWLTLKETVRDGATSISVGFISAIYLTPIAVDSLASVLDTNRPDIIIGAAGFLVGLSGVALIGALIDLWRSSILFKNRQAESQSNDRQTD